MLEVAKWSMQILGDNPVTLYGSTFLFLIYHIFIREGQGISFPLSNSPLIIDWVPPGLTMSQVFMIALFVHTSLMCTLSSRTPQACVPLLLLSHYVFVKHKKQMLDIYCKKWSRQKRSRSPHRWWSLSLKLSWLHGSCMVPIPSINFHQLHLNWNNFTYDTRCSESTGPFVLTRGRPSCIFWSK
jgi:type IV secretory pathway VirB3-like protein